MKIRHITETTAGATSSGSVATVASPLGTMETRMQKPPKSPKVKTMRDKGKKFVNQISEGKMKELYYDLQHMDNGNFKKKYGKTKEEMRSSLKEGKGLADKIAGKLKKNVEKSNKEKKDTEEKVKQHQQDQKDKVSEAEISEADLIIVPGMRKSKDTSFIPHKEDRRDHEVEMARSDLLAAAKNAMRMYKLLKDRTEDQGLMGWQQSYITLATDYLQSVADNLEYDARTDEMTGGVLAGGMSNFEEGRYYDPMGDERREQQRYDDERETFKRREQNVGVENEPNNYAVAIDGRQWKVFSDRRQAENIARSLRNKGKKAEVYATGASVSENQEVVNELSPKTKKSYAAAAKQDKEFNQRGIDQALDRAKKDQKPGRAEWEDEAKFLQSVNAKRDRGLKRAGVAEGSLNEFAPDGFFGGDEGGGKGPKAKAKAKAQMIKAYGPGIITFRKTSNGGYFVQHEDDFGDTNSHQYDPQTGKVDFSGVTRSSYYGEGVAEGKAHKCPKCGGEMVSEELMNEKKDACYYKVKSRYKVWPSAYASGALVKCRKKGSKNWGKSKKK